MPDIYDQHKAAFPAVSAYVVLRGSEKVATIAFKYPRNGAGRLYAYVHWLGVPMVRGFAGGYGYDKHSAAASNAALKLVPNSEMNDPFLAGKFASALIGDDGHYWNHRLEQAGFTVFQAV